MQLTATFSSIACTAILLLSAPILHAQTLRGRVTDADNGKAITGATITLRFNGAAAAPVSLASNPGGEFVFEQLKPGYYTVDVSAQDYENQIIKEVNVASGKEQILDIALRISPTPLAELTISANRPGKRPLMSIGEIPLTREQTLRFPSMYFDPARLATAYPGVAQADDGTNVISIRGNNPAYVGWMLEGVEIVNPNHLPNAGTFSDRPAGASGGVLMFSAQLLDNSSLISGLAPAGYGNHAGGIFDMNLRSGNTRQHEFTAQAGLIGLDVAAEGPLGKNKNAEWSYIANYRYSTVGLLGQLGVSFGDEQINFQDLSFNISRTGKKGYRFNLFGMGGHSQNIFGNKTDTAEIKAYKDFFDIKFYSTTGVIGINNWIPLSRTRSLKIAAAYSGQFSRRTSLTEAFINQNIEDDLNEQKLSANLTYSERLGEHFLQLIGVNAVKYYFDGRSSVIQQQSTRIDRNYVLIQPWTSSNWSTRNRKWSATLGLHGLLLSNPFRIFTGQDKYTGRLEPRASLSYQPLKAHKFTISGGRQHQIPQQWFFTNVSLLIDGWKAAFAWNWRPSEKWSVKAEVFDQSLESGLQFIRVNGISLLNNVEFSLQYADGTPSFIVEGRNQGIELGVERFLSGGWFAMANTTLMQSEQQISGGKAVPTRWDIGHISNVVFGKEWQKEKRPGRERVIGLNTRLVWAGAPRETDILLTAPENITEYNETKGYYYEYPDYFRIDLRVYWRKYIGNRRNATFALEFQNLTNQLNLAYHYYDPYTKHIETKYQLGTIPNFSWRVEF